MLNLIDPENESFGLNVFNLDIDDPQGTNALGANIIEELDILLKVIRIQNYKFFIFLYRKTKTQK